MRQRLANSLGSEYMPVASHALLQGASSNRDSVENTTADITKKRDDFPKVFVSVTLIKRG